MMKARAALLAVGVALVAVACEKPISEDPYWKRSDLLFLEFLDSKDATESAKIRRTTAVLEHPVWANKYHDLLVSFMSLAIEQNEMAKKFQDLGSLAADAAEAKGGTDTRRVLEVIDNGLKAHKEYNKQGEELRYKLGAERQRLGGPPWPIPAMRRNFTAPTPAP